MTKVSFNPGTASGIVQSNHAAVLNYLASLPGPGDVSGPADANAWAVQTGPNAFECSRLACDEVEYLTGTKERPDPSVPAGPLFYG